MSHTNPQRLLLAFKWMFGGIVLVSLLLAWGVLSRVNNDKLEAAQQEASFKLGQVELGMTLLLNRFTVLMKGLQLNPDDAAVFQRLADRPKGPDQAEAARLLRSELYRILPLQQAIWAHSDGQVAVHVEKRDGQVLNVGTSGPLQDHPAWQPQLGQLQALEFIARLQQAHPTSGTGQLLWLSTPWVHQGQTRGYLMLGVALPSLSQPPFRQTDNPHEPAMLLMDEQGRQLRPFNHNPATSPPKTSPTSAQPVDATAPLVNLATDQPGLWADMQRASNGQEGHEVWQRLNLANRSYAGGKLVQAPDLWVLTAVNEHKLHIEKNETLRWAAILWLLGITGTALALWLGYRVARDFVVLQRREARLRRVARLGYWRYEPSSQRFEASADVWRTSGYEDAARFKLSQFMTTLLRPQDRDTFSQALDRVIAESGTFEMEALCSTRMGNEVWVNIVGKSYQHEGEPLSIEGSIQNITDRKTAELAKNAMRDFVENVIDLAQLGVFEIDLRNGVRVVNKHMRNMLGIQGPAEPDIQVLALEERVHPEDLSQLLQKRQNYLAGKSSDYRASFRVRHELGHWVWLFGEGQVVARDDKGQALLLRGVHIDITVVQEAREQAEAANRVKTEFLSRMSHELRSPLNSIMGYAQLLRMEGMNERQEDHLSNVLSGAQHMLKLVNDLLHITKNQPELVPLLKPTSLSRLVQASLNMAAPQAQERQITLSHDLSAANGVQADPLRLQQVLINLLSNAIKYSREGAQVHILSSVLRSGHVRLTVRDQGPGIEAAVGERVFEPFYRGAQAEFGFEGAGIGLTVCKQLVEAMRGKISYQSILGVGSEFHVDLPPALVAPEVVPEVAPEGTSVAASLAG